MSARRLAAVVLGAAASGVTAQSRPSAPERPDARAHFNAGFLQGANPVDISRFEQGNVTLPGMYRPDLWLNGEPMPGTWSIVFRSMPGRTSAQPCFDMPILIRLGLDPARLAAPAAEADEIAGRPDGSCAPLPSLVPDATVNFDDGEQQLYVTLPQAYLASRARGYVNPQLWDAGESAATLDYNVNTSQRGFHANLRAGANLGGWRLRHAGSFAADDSGTRWRNTLIYAQRDLTSTGAQLTVGEVFTPADILDPVRIRGIGMASDPRMLPLSRRGYAPVIRGVAESNAQVAIRQNGYLIHSVSVSPGAFVIDDLYPTGYGSDLEVRITEADGRTRTFTVPFTSAPQMLREGTARFALWAGHIAEAGVPATPFIAQGTLQYGLTATTTLYTGGTVSSHHGAGLLGTSVNLPFGAVSLDVTGSNARSRAGDTHRGSRTRLRYSRTITTTGTQATIAGHRFSSRHYLGVADAARLRAGRERYAVGERHRIDATVAQSLGRGQVSVAGSLTRYGDEGGHGVSYTVGYGSNWRSVSYNLSWQRSRADDAGDRFETTIWLSLSVPLGDTSRAPAITIGHARDGRQGASTNASISGLVAGDDDLTYNVAASRSTASASVGYRSYAGSVRASASRGGGATQWSLGATGALVAHRDGITLAQELGETNAIVHAPGARGARIESHGGVRIDRFGNAVVRSLQPYQLNRVSIDPRGASQDLDLASTSEAVAPRAGAMVRLDYLTSVAPVLLIHASRAGGAPLPFGASVADAAGHAVGIVGQASRIFVRGDLAGQRLTVAWGEDAAAHCVVNLPKATVSLATEGMHRAIHAECVDE